MSNGLYWIVSNETELAAEYRKHKVASELITTYLNPRRLWRAKKGWFSSVPLYLVIETSQGENNCASMHFIEGPYPFSVRSGEIPNQRLILDGLKDALLKIKVDKLVLLDSLKTIHIHKEEKTTLEKLLDLLEPKKIIELPKPRK